LKGAAVGGRQGPRVVLALSSGDLGADTGVDAPVAGKTLTLQPVGQGRRLPRRIAGGRGKAREPRDQIQSPVGCLNKRKTEEISRAIRLEPGGDDLDRADGRMAMGRVIWPAKMTGGWGRKTPSSPCSS